MILVDAPIAIEEREYTAGGVVIERYAGRALDDTGLIEFAAGAGYRAVVVVADGYLLSRQLKNAAETSGVTLVVVSETHPLRAAQRVRQFAEDLISSRRPVLRLLSHGPEPYEIA